MNLNVMKRTRGSDSRYFTTTKKGEMHELKEELNHQKPEKKREAVKKVIAAMTVGKDVSSLFADVVNCMQTGNVELKKLVYLYLINYAKSQPDLAIMAVNTFRRDANDPNPLVRALAIRTMGCIRVDKIVEYLCEPLRRALADQDPYVRKTAAICVAKLYDVDPRLAVDQGFVDLLRKLLGDPNPTVVANAVAALGEIAENSGEPETVFPVTKSVKNKILNALNECTEWGQVFLLDALARYTPRDGLEAESIVERVSPRLQHSNAAVVMSAVKVIVRLLDSVESRDAVKLLSRKMAPPLVTLLSAEPEIQYVALRNIDLIVSKRPEVLSRDIKVFFCKYNDPIYVKMEKLEILIKLVKDQNVDQVLLEFKEYASEVDVDFVRKAVRAVGRTAIKLERAAERCIGVLLELIHTKVNYVVQEAIVTMKDIFRRFPERYESVISTLCENLETLDEPEAKASMIWIVGEYADRIENADELLEGFLDAFEEETVEVQLQLLTATVKLYLKRPQGANELMEKVLSLATEKSDDPDLRDRGYVYWRLLSSRPEVAKTVVLSEKPVISDDSNRIDPTLLNVLVDNISSLASVYHKPPESFVVLKRADLDDEDEDEDDSYGDSGGDAHGAEKSSDDSSSQEDENQGDLLDFGSETDEGLRSKTKKKKKKNSAASNNTTVVVSNDNGMIVRASVVRNANDDLQLVLNLHNEACAPSPAKFAVKFNKNTFALAPASPGIQLGAPIEQGDSVEVCVPIRVDPKQGDASVDPSTTLEIAMKNFGNDTISYFSVDVPFWCLFIGSVSTDKADFVSQWKSLTHSAAFDVENEDLDDLEELSLALRPKNVEFIATRTSSKGDEKHYFRASTTTGTDAFFEIDLENETGVVKCSTQQLLPFLAKTLAETLA